MSDDEKVTKHPAYGSISISRRQSNGTVLYDSPIPHHHYIAITISHAEDHRSLYRNRHHPRGHILEVALSEAQFAQAITSMNTMGTPCTLARMWNRETDKYELVPSLELVRPERETFEAEVKEATGRVHSQVKDAKDKLEEIMKRGGTVRKGDLKELQGLLYHAEQDVRANLPFIQESFYEAMEGVTAKVKTEIVATAEAVVRQRGLEVTDLLAEGAIRQLGAPEEKPLSSDDIDLNAKPEPAPVGWPDINDGEPPEEDAGWEADADED
jgi:hypothetical protein